MVPAKHLEIKNFRAYSTICEKIVVDNYVIAPFSIVIAPFSIVIAPFSIVIASEAWQSHMKAIITATRLRSLFRMK